MERVLPLFLFAFGELRLLPQPDFDWPPSWILHQMNGKMKEVELSWNIITGALVLLGVSRDLLGLFIILLGLRIWARLLLRQHLIPRYQLILPLFLAIAGWVRFYQFWGDIVLLTVLFSLAIWTLRVSRRRIKPPSPFPPKKHEAYAVLRQASQLNRRSKFSE